MRNIHIVLAAVLVMAIVTAFRLVLVALGSALYVYLLPAVIAGKRNHPKVAELYWICGLAGWLVVPWIAALIYVCKPSDTARAEDMPLLATAADE